MDAASTGSLPMPALQTHVGEPWMLDDSYADSSSAHDAASQYTTTANADADPSDARASSSSIPNNRRRRITRACDECRRKKIKCDGMQPCTHCTVYSYDCTYDQPSHRRRNPAPQYLESLEKRLHRAEALLRMCLGNVNLDDPNLDNLLQQGFTPGTFPQQAASLVPPTSAVVGEDYINRPPEPAATSESAALESMVQGTGRLELDERGHWDYHGHSSNIEFLRRLREGFGAVLDPDRGGKDVLQSSPFLTKPRKRSDGIESPTSPKSPRSYMSSPVQNQDVGHDDLPSREIAKELCSHALDDACAIISVVHRPSFDRSLDRIYDLSHSDFEDEDHRFLPLLYVVLALGCLFASDEQSDLDRKGYQSATDEGYKYFWISRQLMDVTDCRDLTSLQAIIFMILFLQCSAKLATCYSYIGIALRSALRMGLHRSFKDSFDPIETQLRKTLFWVIRKMDIYVGAIIGLPQPLSDDDVDQEFPAEVDDANITKMGIVPMPEGSVSINAAANANFKLTLILAKIMKDIYPIKGFKTREESRSHPYTVGYSSIREIENDLQTWMESLPDALKPGGDAPMHHLRVQYLLRVAYANAQMMLYRPFLHYVSSRDPSKPINERSYACAAACISVSRNIVHITADMKSRNLLVGSYWFIMYTTFFAILSLVFYALENKDNPTSHDIMYEAREGKDTLASLAKRSMAADRCMSTLNALFDHLPEHLQRYAHQRPTGVRKREDPTPSTAYQNSQGDGQRQFDSPKRAKTFPQQATQGQQHANIAPRPQKNVRLNANSTANVGTSKRRGSHLYTPSVAADAPCAIATTISPSQSVQQTMGTFVHHELPNLYQGNISDLSAMMFPSADPFAYPNQPMTTLEQAHAYSKSGQYGQGFAGSHFMPASTSEAHSVAADDHIDVQLFGPLPAHLMHNGLQQPAYQYGTQEGFGRAEHGQHLPTSSAEIWSQQRSDHGFPGMNFHDIFGGEEWKAGMTGN